MLRLLNGTYVAIVHGKRVTLKLLGNNRCEIYIKSAYKCIGPFDYIKEQINLLEQLQPQTGIEYIEDLVFFRELNGKTIDVKI